MKRYSWFVLLIVVLGAFIVGGASRPSQTLQARTERVANTLKCPVCAGESVADSQVTVARSMRQEISERLLAGDSPNQIRSYFVSRYGPDILLKPKASGAGLVVWLIPMIALVAIGYSAFHLISRWRARPVIVLSDAEEREVEKALGL